MAQINSALTKIRNAKSKVNEGNKSLEACTNCNKVVSVATESLIGDSRYSTTICGLSNKMSSEAAYILKQLSGKEYGLEQEYKYISREDSLYHEEQARLLREALAAQANAKSQGNKKS